jgi:hypothetical protein
VGGWSLLQALWAKENITIEDLGDTKAVSCAEVLAIYPVSGLEGGGEEWCARVRVCVRWGVTS